MSNPELGPVERRVLRALRSQSTATSGQIAALLGDTGASSVVLASAELVRNKLVEPVPDEQGAFRLTPKGAKLAAELPAEHAEPGSGGGESGFN